MANKWFAVEGYADGDATVNDLSDVAFRVWVGLHQYVAEHDRPLPMSENKAARCLVGLDETRVRKGIKELLAANLITVAEIGGIRGYATDFLVDDTGEKIQKKLDRSARTRAQHERRRKKLSRDLEAASGELNATQQKTIVQVKPVALIPHDGNLNNNNDGGSANALQVQCSSTAHYTLRTGPNAQGTVPNALYPVHETLGTTHEARRPKPVNISYALSPELGEWVERFLAAYPPHPSGNPWPESPALWRGAAGQIGSEFRDTILKTWAQTYRTEWLDVPVSVRVRDGAAAHLWDKKQQTRIDFPMIEQGVPIPPSTWLRWVAAKKIRYWEWQAAFQGAAEARWLFEAVTTRAAHGDLPPPADDFDKRMRAEWKGLY
jgi:hypothetical protein